MKDGLNGRGGGGCSYAAEKKTGRFITMVCLFFLRPERGSAVESYYYIYVYSMFAVDNLNTFSDVLRYTVCIPFFGEFPKKKR